MATFTSGMLIIGVLLIPGSDGQSSSVGSSIYDSLQPLGCSQFLTILNKCRETVRDLYKGDVRWTVFAPNDKAFELLPPLRLQQILNMNQNQSEDYVMAFTVPKVIPTTSFQENRPEQSRSRHGTFIFFTIRQVREGNSASGIGGSTEYYANGAMVLRPNIQAGNSLIHVTDRVLEIASDKSLLAYISTTGPHNSDTTFHRDILSFIDRGEYYDQAVEPLNSGQRVTAFIPTREAISRIPSSKLELLRGNPTLLRDVILRHIVPYQVLYTSFVYHNEGVNTLGKSQLIFRTSTNREAVYVSSGGVTGEIMHGNITCKNGALHFVDSLLGYTYNTALEEIEVNPLTQVFEDLLQGVNSELQKNIVHSSGVTIFVPTNQAFRDIPDADSLQRNNLLLNKMVELSMLELGQEIEVTKVNGDYEARRTLTSAFNRRTINVYSQGNETWVESGYVKARVVRPDLAVTNGFVHLIDAVPGIPSRDVPNTIFCEDWLIKPAQQLGVVGLNDYMRDLSLSSLAPCTTRAGVRTYADVYTALNRDFHQQSSTSDSRTKACGLHCSFTVFVPNGTAIDNFERQPAGRFIQESPQLWHHVLSRHVTRSVIYLDQVAVGVERTYQALNGDLVRYRRVTKTYTYIYFRGKQARVLHSDLGGTNGVVHIVDQVIFVTDDLTATSSQPEASVAVLVLLGLVLALCRL